MQTKNIKTLEKEFILKSSHRVTFRNPTKNEPTAGIIIEGHFSIAASEKKVLLKSVWKYPLATTGTIKKPVNRFALQINCLLFTQHKLLPKGVYK